MEPRNAPSGAVSLGLNISGLVTPVQVYFTLDSRGVKRDQPLVSTKIYQNEGSHHLEG